MLWDDAMMILPSGVKQGSCPCGAGHSSATAHACMQSPNLIPVRNLMHAICKPDTCQELDVWDAAMQSFSGCMSLSYSVTPQHALHGNAARHGHLHSAA